MLPSMFLTCQNLHTSLESQKRYAKQITNKLYDFLYQSGDKVRSVICSMSKVIESYVSEL